MSYGAGTVPSYRCALVAQPVRRSAPLKIKTTQADGSPALTTRTCATGPRRTRALPACCKTGREIPQSSGKKCTLAHLLTALKEAARAVLSRVQTRKLVQGDEVRCKLYS
jgi:hypothetical protein